MFFIRKSPCGRITFNCTMEQQCVWGMKLLKTQIKLKDNEELDINDGNLWSILVCKINIDSEDKLRFTPSPHLQIHQQGHQHSCGHRPARWAGCREESKPSINSEPQHQLITLTWQENELFEVSFSGTFREFVREPLKLQLRNSKVCFISACWTDFWGPSLHHLRRVLDHSGEGVLALYCTLHRADWGVETSRSSCRDPTSSLVERSECGRGVRVLSVHRALQSAADALRSE